MKNTNRLHMRLDEDHNPKDFEAVLDRLAFESRHYMLSGVISRSDATELHRWMVAAAKVSNGPVTLHITSEGGDVFSGVSMIQSITYLRGQGIRVTGLVEGQAMSMASIILQACDHRVMTPMSVLMCHGVTFWSRGDLKNNRLELKLAEALTERVIDLYVARAHGIYADRTFWTTQLESSDPLYLMAPDALSAGLIDEVVA
jgi:ATP-dependent protease ClpP protease subunit